MARIEHDVVHGEAVVASADRDRADRQIDLVRAVIDVADLVGDRLRGVIPHGDRQRDMVSVLCAERVFTCARGSNVTYIDSATAPRLPSRSNSILPRWNLLIAYLFVPAVLYFIDSFVGHRVPERALLRAEVGPRSQRSAPCTSCAPVSGVQ